MYITSGKTVLYNINRYKSLNDNCYSKFTQDMFDNLENHSGWYNDISNQIREHLNVNFKTGNISTNDYLTLYKRYAMGIDEEELRAFLIDVYNSMDEFIKNDKMTGFRPILYWK